MCDKYDIKDIQDSIEKVRKNEIETIVPIYITNYCNSDCKICEMRKSNNHMKRKRGSLKEIKEQLIILYEIEKVRAVLILSGEFLEGEERENNFNMIIETIQAAFDMGFKKVNFNIGSLTNEEINRLYNIFKDKYKDKLCLSLFQETYDINAYHSFFGNEVSSIPKSHYNFRLSTPKRWISKGFKRINIGILIGLTEVSKDIDSLIKHANELHEMGAEVEISMPRIRGMEEIPYEVSDDEFIKSVLTVAKACPWAKIILTTREDINILKKLLPVIGVISPGTSDILPYTTEGEIPNNKETSQFFIKENRPRPSWILDEIEECIDGPIKYYENDRNF
ncbi:MULTISPECIES: thiamine biosynthesis protein ThiH [Clostridium]|uniref:Thiamine biosynthesis protein ThiH n=1 Tax=Clostridium botulinum TaxID=1491 RepID=A0ABD7CF58_CLOBO|nr:MULTISPECIES: thiamine biosynthesis protein ThiH [Clostridium]KGO15600.1 thiamine biosynthesis protein ThiH [Clostridium botulinum]KOY66154.1 thiamine biosynthesis protein ThiH [Clostridium sporogenes]MDS1006404.1 thiamine biosynthesis protein ThiH [Clostridium sporogenes]QRI52000.1 thiamine biosynthesis protein ThiH [Clostridium botulinum]